MVRFQVPTIPESLEYAQMSLELKGKMKGCVSENEMFQQWEELCKGERSYRAVYK